MSEIAQVKFCSQCGSSSSEIGRFCTTCGAELVKTHQSPSQKSPDNHSAVNDAPAERNQARKTQKTNEEWAIVVIDGLFSLIYLYVIYGVLYTDEISESMGGAELLGLLAAFGVLYIIQKIIKSVIGTIARSVDSLGGS